jgi:hypothetical protein
MEERSSFLLFISAVVGGKPISFGNFGVGGLGSKLDTLFFSSAVIEEPETPLIVTV